VANGKYYGHGLCVAPDASITDQLLNIFICGDVSVLDFIKQSETLKMGERVMLKEVHYKTTNDLRLISDDTCLIEGDGEVFGKLPARISLSGRTVDMLSFL
jgi:diacylglycerol kinase family enzyme